MLNADAVQADAHGLLLGCGQRTAPEVRTSLNHLAALEFCAIS